MFTLESILEAHAQFSGPDFPKLLAVFKEMGMVSNQVDIEMGQVTYIAQDDTVLVNDGYKVTSNIADYPNKYQVEADLKRHQAGETDFPTFCEDMAKSGIVGWVIDLEQMTCTYLDKTENAVLVETVPSL